MANQQTRWLRKQNKSVKVVKGAEVDNRECSNGKQPSWLEFKECPRGTQPSKRRQSWKPAVKSSREIVYPAEFKRSASVAR